MNTMGTPHIRTDRFVSLGASLFIDRINREIPHRSTLPVATKGRKKIARLR